MKESKPMFCVVTYWQCIQ